MLFKSLSSWYSGHQERTRSDPRQPQVSVPLISRPVVSYRKGGTTPPLVESGCIKLFLSCDLLSFEILFLFLDFSMVLVLELVFFFESRVYMLSRGLLTVCAYIG